MTASQDAQNQTKNRKNIYFVIGFLILLIILLALIKFPSQDSTSLPTPTPTPVSQDPDKFQLVSINPQPGKHETIISTYPIKFTFNQEIHQESLEFISDFPREIIVKLEGEGKTIALYPQIGWDLSKTHRITLNRVISTQGEEIDKPIEYEFKIIFPTLGPESFPE